MNEHDVPYRYNRGTRGWSRVMACSKIGNSPGDRSRSYSGSSDRCCGRSSVVNVDGRSRDINREAVLRAGAWLRLVGELG